MSGNGEVEIGRCSECGQELLRTATDCWHAAVTMRQAGVVCPPEVLVHGVLRPAFGDGFGRPGRDKWRHPDALPLSHYVMGEDGAVSANVTGEGRAAPLSVRGRLTSETPEGPYIENGVLRNAPPLIAGETWSESFGRTPEDVARGRERAESWSIRPGPTVHTHLAVPHGGSSPHSGADTSRASAEEQDARGASLDRQQRTVELLEQWRERGLTWRELSVRGPREGTRVWDHGQASGVLGRLDRAGVIVRLAEQRERCSVYVLKAYQAGREPGTTTRRPRPERCLTAEQLDAAKRLRQEWRDGGQALFTTVRSQDLTELLDAILPGIDGAS